MAGLTPLGVAEHELDAMLDLERMYIAGETSYPINDSNHAALAEIVAAMPERVARLRYG